MVGCSGSHGQGDAEAARFDDVVAPALDAQSLDPLVREILVEAQSRGELTFEDYRQGLDVFADCLAGLGVEISFIEGDNAGLRDVAQRAQPAPGSGVGIDRVNELRDQCAASTFNPLSSVYHRQPAAVEAADRHFDEYRERLVSCLRENGAEMPDDATRDEVVTLTVEQADAGGTDCLLETGYVSVPQVNATGEWG
jgi:hypothetical protein